MNLDQKNEQKFVFLVEFLLKPALSNFCPKTLETINDFGPALLVSSFKFIRAGLCPVKVVPHIRVYIV